MNIYELNILKAIGQQSFSSQRELARTAKCSLGLVNRCLKSLEESHYLDESRNLSEEARILLNKTSPRRAIILAAGVGMRMVPINMEQPKALITIQGEVMIERLIRQLQEVGIHEIYIVVGFMKEKFEYLIDRFGVKLVVNRDYASSNNLHSLSLVKEKLDNSYILPCDIWCQTNPFSKSEVYSWYMVKSSESLLSEVRVNRKQELVRIHKGEPGNPMVGISYITAQDAPSIKSSLEKLSADPKHDQSFWEEILYAEGKMRVYARLIPPEQAVEINTYEQLRNLDSGSEQLQSAAITTACQVLKAGPEEIKNITALKKGMTNRSFLFSCRDCKYIMRIPGEGTDHLINRREEASVYDCIQGKGLCDDIIYINPDNGYKITKFISNARCCNPECEQDLRECMAFLKAFHQQELKASHRFEIFDKIEFYEELWNGQPSAYQDYEETKQNVYALRDYINMHAGKDILTHIDAVPDNFLLFQGEDGKNHIRLIDWEYSAMQDPHVDIAMFCIYALYDKQQIDHLIDLYFENTCTLENRIKIYCYVAACGLLWSNWCEYKRNLGVEFGEYSLCQYRYAKEYYRYAVSSMKTLQAERGKSNV